MNSLSLCFFWLSLSLIPFSLSSDSNGNLDKCELTVFDGVNYTDTSYGPFECGDYQSDNGDFEDNNADSIIFTNYDNFTCYAYLFTDWFDGYVLLLNGTGVDDMYLSPNISDITDDASTTSVSNTHYYHSLDDYGFGDTITSITIRYQSTFCRVSFFSSDHQSSQTGSTLGIGGVYTYYLLKAHGIKDDSVTSLSVRGDDSCWLSLYSDDSCDSLMLTVNGTGDWDLAELESKGFNNDDLSCAIVGANSGLKSLEWHTNEAVIKNQSILVGNSQTIKNKAATTISTTVELTKTETSSWSFSEKFDFSISISDKISVSIPDIVSIDLTISYSFDFSWTTTYSGSTTTSFDQSSTISVPAYTSVRCDLYISKADLSVPYTAVFQEIDEYNLYYTKTVNGTYKTTSYYADFIECDDLKSTTTSPDSNDNNNNNNNNNTQTGGDTVVSTTQPNTQVLKTTGSDRSGSGGDTGNSNDSSDGNSWAIVLVVGILIGLCIVMIGCLGFYYINRKHQWRVLEYKSKLIEEENNDKNSANVPYEKL